MSSRKDVLRPFEEKKDYMNDRIDSGIEANRKGFAFLNLTDEKGEAVKNAEVKITQTAHDFKYGANLGMGQGMVQRPPLVMTEGGDNVISTF